MIKKFNILFITLFKIGNLKYAPGTIASFITCVFFFILNNYFSITTIFFITVLCFLYSLIAINNSYETFDSKDPQEIVIDEFIGQLLPLIAIPIYETLYPVPSLYYYITAFGVFRFFDIIKPFPINYIDKNTKGAMGVLLDDIVAGLFSIFTLSIIFFFLGG